MTPTYDQIARSFTTWREHFDTGGYMDEGTFDGLSFEDRLALLTHALGPEPIVRYFESTVNDWWRITTVIGYKDSDFDGFPDEWQKEDLPEDFDTWQEYASGANGTGMSFKTWSPDGL